LIGSIFGGASSTVTKIGLFEIPPYSFSFLRFFISALFVLPWFIKGLKKFDKDLIFLILVSLLPIINIALFVFGVKTTTASIGQLLYAGSPIIVVLLSFLYLKEKVSLKKLFYIFIGLVGTFLVIFLPVIQKGAAFSGDLKGNILISIGVLFYSLYLVLSKPLLKKYSPKFITSVFIMLGTIVFFFLSLTELDTQFWLQLSAPSIYSVLFISVFGTVLVYVLGQYAIKWGSSLISSLSLYLLPIFAFIYAFFLLGETMTTGLIIGTILVFISVFLTTYSKK
jgi:drug/metabolite transporter (DMT)-like permease